MKHTRSLFAVLVLAAAGCHMCSDCCDYSSPVANGPYAGTGGRAGSNLSGMNAAVAMPDAYQAPVAAPSETPVTEPPAQPLP